MSLYLFWRFVKWMDMENISMCGAYLEKEMATHSSVLAWRIPGMGELGGLSSLGSYRVGHNWSDLAAAAAVVLISSVQSLSTGRLCDPIDCSMPGLPVHHWLQEFTQTHVCCFGDAIQPSHPLCVPFSSIFGNSLSRLGIAAAAKLL